jgi:hypothetical protein
MDQTLALTSYSMPDRVPPPSHRHAAPCGYVYISWFLASSPSFSPKPTQGPGHGWTTTTRRTLPRLHPRPDATTQAAPSAPNGLGTRSPSSPTGHRARSSAAASLGLSERRTVPAQFTASMSRRMASSSPITRSVPLTTPWNFGVSCKPGFVLHFLVLVAIDRRSIRGLSSSPVVVSNRTSVRCSSRTFLVRCCRCSVRGEDCPICRTGNDRMMVPQIQHRALLFLQFFKLDPVEIPGRSPPRKKRS